MGQARDGSVKNLQELYTVTVGAALTLAIVRFAPESGTPVWRSFPMLVAYVVTLVPFYHGAMRHLDVTYRQAGAPAVREGALLADFFLLFIEACLLLALANVVVHSMQAAWIFLALFALDGLWGMAAYWVFAKTRRSWAEIRWSLINICTSVILLASLLFVSSSSWVSPPSRLEISFAVICVGRTVADYWWSWAFYFPKR